MKHVTTDAPHHEIFKHLQKMGYKKTSGYDPEPHSFTMHHNREEMTSTSDPLHHPSGVSAHIEAEHGEKTKVHFTHRKLSESRAHKIITTKLANMDRMKNVQIPTPAERRAQLEKQKQVKEETNQLTEALSVGDDVQCNKTFRHGKVTKVDDGKVTVKYKDGSTETGDDNWWTKTVLGEQLYKRGRFVSGAGKKPFKAPVQASPRLEESRKAEIVKDIIKKKKSEKFNPDPELGSTQVKADTANTTTG